MDKTISINLGGTLFQIDEEAYRILRNYIQSIDHKFKNVPGGNETIEDIEFRIAELFLSKKGTAGVISKENVEEVITIIGKPEDFEHPDSDAATGNYTYSSSSKRKGMYRNPENSIIGGVCGGFGAYLNTDPVWFRILFVASALMFGLGIFIYLALWLALPVAATDTQKKEMYGGSHNPAQSQDWDNNPGSRVGHAVNEVFKAFGRVIYIIVRILLIVFGTSLVLAGFLALLTFVMVIIFKYPGAFSTDITGISFSYLPDFLNYIFSPKMVNWIKGLSIIVVSLPLLALIYGGIRMIFWFRAKDGFIWLAGFVLWVMSAAALSIILFDEGIGFAENGRTSKMEYFTSAPDTLYIRSGIKLSDIQVDKEIIIPGERNDIIYLSKEKNEIYFRTHLNISPNDNNPGSIEIRKNSAGRSRLDARTKSEKLLYNFNLKGKELYLDEFFTIPQERKWSLDYVSVKVSVPKGTIIYMDKTIETIYHSIHDEDYVSDPKNRFWLMTEDGLEYIEPDHSDK